jgi:Protein of unknown function (DUF2384)
MQKTGMLTHRQTVPDLSSADTAARALAVFFRIAERWGLTAPQKQTLLGASRTVFFRWQAGKVSAGLDAATAERLSYLFRIYAALQILLPVRERADTWLQLPNACPLFGGDSALSRLLGGQVGDLKDVADFLDAQRGGDFA